jgi:hypothetical protein
MFARSKIREAPMPNGGDGDLFKFTGLIDLTPVERAQWHIEVARRLRFFADRIEADGIKWPPSTITIENTVDCFQYGLR